MTKFYHEGRWWDNLLSAGKKPEEMSPIMMFNYQEFIKRNFTIFSDQEQEILRKATVAIAGLGGIGGLLSERLIRLGVENLVLADPGRFQLSDMNRQFASSLHTLGQYKAETICSDLKRINPNANIVYYSKGITNFKDAALIAEQSNVIVDVMDYGLFKLSSFLQKAAREHGRYYTFSFAAAFGAVLVNFPPQGMTLDEYNGINENTDQDQLRSTFPINKVLPVFPSYLKGKEPILRQMLVGHLPTSAISIGAGLAALMSATETVNILLNKAPLISAPNYIYFDLLDKLYMSSSIKEK